MNITANQPRIDFIDTAVGETVTLSYNGSAYRIESSTQIQTPSIDVSEIKNLISIEYVPNPYTIGVDTPTALYIEFIDSGFDKWMSTGTDNAWDWKKMNP